MTKLIALLGMVATLGTLSGCAGFGDGGYYPGGYGLAEPGFEGGYDDGPGMYAPSFGYMGGFNGGYGGGYAGGDDDDDD